MRLPSARTALVVLLGASVLSCTDSLTSVKRPSPFGTVAHDATSGTPVLVISQVYGGGGNNGSTYYNDFIEIFNAGSGAATIQGWSVQYASAAGTSWQVTKLPNATIPAGGYFLVSESRGTTGGTTELPAADAIGTIPMSGTDGKVALVSSQAALSGACPTAVDVVSYGSVNSGATCSLPAAAPKLSNSTAALRLQAGCTITGVPANDFVAKPAAPRNSAAPAHFCVAPAPLDHLTISQGAAASVVAGTTLALTATPQDKDNNTVSATVTWASDDQSIATVDTKGIVTGVSVSTKTAKITATATALDANGNAIVRTATIDITVKNPGINWVDLSSSATSVPPGFQTQLFATARTAQNGTIIDSATFTFEALDPAIATITTVNNTGIITAVAPQNGSTKPGFRITAVPKDGGDPYTFVTHPVTIEALNFASPSIYGPNDEFGDPTPVSSSNPNDLLIRRPQYVLSYNESRGTPNWVAYELDARQFGNEDRCNCFTADPNLPADKQILTSDYTGSGYDRGHMTRSADRTVANGDNATTFYLTNVVPQTAPLNQGVWAAFEDSLADSARIGGRAVYIITGPLYSRSNSLRFVKNEGKVAIPDSTWKIAFIGPRTAGNPFTRANVQDWSDLANVTVVAVNMPNNLADTVGIRKAPWTSFRTTVDQIEQATGYDFLSKLPTALQDALEADDHAPQAKFAVIGAAREASPVTFDASASMDADIGREKFSRTEALTYTWTFSDGGTASGKTVTHTFGRFGSYTATLTVTDVFGWPSTVTQSVDVADVAPTVSALPNASLITGEQYTASGTFSDPGLDSWTATVAYVDPNDPTALALDGNAFTLEHVYATEGTFTITVTVFDGEQSGVSRAVVTVETPLQAIRDLTKMVQSLAAQQSRMLVASSDAGAPQLVQPLVASLDAASKQIQAGKNGPATNELDAFINKVNAAAMTGRLELTTARQMTSLAARIQRALTLD